MDNNNNHNNNNLDYSEFEGKSFKDYLSLIRKNLLPFLIIFIVGIALTASYVLTRPDIFVSESAVKISKTGGSILQNESILGLSDLANDRMINNEIEILKSFDLRNIVADALLDSFKISHNKSEFALISKLDVSLQKTNKKVFEGPYLEELLGTIVDVKQKRGLDVIVISAQSPSALEAYMIANLYTKVYRTYNLEINREQLSFVRDFLDRQRSEKKQQLVQAEDTLRAFQEKGGIIALDEQAKSLIEQLSEFEAQMNAAKIELTASEEMLRKYKEELAKQDPRLADYLASVTSESYIKALQDQIAELQLNKDIAFAKIEPGIDISQKVKEFDSKIQELNQKLDEKIKVLKAGILASSPEEVRDISQKIIEAEVKTQSLQSQVRSLSSVVKTYENRFNRLPKTTLEFARFQRMRESSEKLFTLIEQKYQEAVINEQSQAGNVLIIDNARIPLKPAKPNKPLLALVGLLIALGAAFGYVLVKDYFDDTIKSPEDIEKQKVHVLAWIPKISELNGKSTNGDDLVIEKNPDSIPSETIRALRTRVQFSKVDRANMKTILITSPAPQEGKSTIAINLAASFAHSNKHTLIIDADLRKPRLHQVFKKERTPGLIDYLFGDVAFEKVINATAVKNLSIITAGTMAHNPSEILDSPQMEQLLKKVRDEFDYIIIDSPPIVAVTDAEILARKVDGSILVVSFNKTDKGLLERGVHLLKNEHSYLIGSVLNNFSTTSGYGGYYKYYYYYSPKGEKKKKHHGRQDAEVNRES